MANLIHMYGGTVTAGSTDGIQISEGNESNPLTIGPLNASNNEESAPVKVALRCDSGYVSSGNTVITPQGTTNAKWALAPDNAGAAGSFGEYGAAFTISSAINSTNTIFWVKAKTSSDEAPSNDDSVNLNVQTIIVAQ
ncbi:MAG: hypothetical protein K0R54_4832 [Clostridiaceae bacterium]|jgi:hypothetical protein|nr:hypothetical protein [Clostridiaceae bacterium]